jgi:hypothetical protein
MKIVSSFGSRVSSVFGMKEYQVRRPVKGRAMGKIKTGVLVTR